MEFVNIIQQKTGNNQPFLFFFSNKMRPGTDHRWLPVASVVLLALLTYFNADPLGAVEYELGVTGGLSARFRDDFDSAMGRYRSNILFTGIRSSSGNPLSLDGHGGVQIGLRGVLGEQSRVGLSLGSYAFSGGQTRELRDTPGVFHGQWNYSASYFLLTYHSIFDPVKTIFPGYWQPEVGGGFGFIPEFIWRGSGYNFQNGQFRDFQSFQRSAFPMILMLEGAISRPISKRFRFRMGLRLQYSYISGFQGTVNGANGSFYTMSDGSIAPITENTVSFLPPESVTGDAAYGKNGVVIGVQKRVSLSLSHVSFIAGITLHIR